MAATTFLYWKWMRWHRYLFRAIQPYEVIYAVSYIKYYVNQIKLETRVCSIGLSILLLIT